MKTFALLAALFLTHTMALQADSIFDIPLKDIQGKDASLAAYKGQVILIVNVASKCGFTKQYAPLEAMYAKYKDKGLVVAGFPCNQFKEQEPGTDAEIADFCSLTYGVKFPMFSKLDVNGAQRHPLYVILAGEKSPFPGDIKWNFTKFLIGRDGTILKRYDSAVSPDSPQVVKDIEDALAAK